MLQNREVVFHYLVNFLQDYPYHPFFVVYLRVLAVNSSAFTLVLVLSHIKELPLQVGAGLPLDLPR